MNAQFAHLYLMHFVQCVWVFFWMKPLYRIVYDIAIRFHVAVVIFINIKNEGHFCSFIQLISVKLINYCVFLLFSVFKYSNWSSCETWCFEGVNYAWTWCIVSIRMVFPVFSVLHLTFISIMDHQSDWEKHQFHQNWKICSSCSWV